MDRQLPENYQRAFCAMLQLIEEKLVAMEANFIKYQFSRRANVTWNDDLTVQSKEKLHKKIEEMYEELRNFNKQYSLEMRDMSLRHLINVNNAFIWEDLENCRGKRLSGHGYVDREILENLDAFLDRMIKINKVITQIVNE